MAVISEMEVKVSADVKGMQTGLQKAQTELVKLENLLSKASNPKSVQILESSIGKLKSKIEVLNASTNNLVGTQSKFVQGSNQASNALLNLGRVAQDAPFGFIGISNNINPLLESFQRLKVETGSTKGALAALSSSLMGGAGLGLAVSVATGLLTVLAQKGFFSAGKAAEDAKTKSDDYKKSIDAIFESTSKELVNVQSLIAVLNSETATRKRKLDVLNELKSIQPEIFNGLKLEGDAVVGLDMAYKNYLTNLKAVIAVKIKQQQLEKVTEEILKKEGVTLTNQEQTLVNFGKAAKANLKLQAEKTYNQILLNNIEKQDLKNQSEKNSLYKEQTRLLKDISELQAGVVVSSVIDKPTKAKKIVLDVDKEKSRENVFNWLKEIVGDVAGKTVKITLRPELTKITTAGDALLKLQDSQKQGADEYAKAMAEIYSQSAIFSI